VEIVLADGLKLCFPKESFDMVICADIIEHIQDECTFLNEVRNVLKPGGYLLITAPASKRLWSRMDEELGHHRRYDLSGMRSLLWESRFRDIRIRYWNSIPFPLMLLYRRLLNPGFARELKVGNRFNSILYRLLKLEELVNLPFGASLFAVARRT